MLYTTCGEGLPARGCEFATACDLRILFNQIAHPFDEDAHLCREVTALGIHHRYRPLCRCPVSEHLHELTRLQVWPHHVAGNLHDSKVHKTGDHISIGIVHREDAIQCELDVLFPTREFPVHDAPGAI
jgi:hypothetical protein